MNDTGIVSERKARSTGSLIRVIDNRDGWFLVPAAENPWVTECMDHGQNCSHMTRKLALWHRFYPIGPGQVVDALAAGEAERIVRHLVADKHAPEWAAVPGPADVRTVVKHIREMEENR